ncbi:MAG TPA: hypothetical protein VEW69_01825 [Alphaproteobacteria bacterium]|nr:hypothetical protein [Alphaproteobacteria bacterium]
MITVRVLVLALLCLTALNGQQTAAPKVSEAQSNQQKARAVLDKMIQAMGGQAYLTADDYQSSGRYGRFYHGDLAGGTEYVRFWKWPNKNRWELTKQRDVINIFIGDQVYEVTYKGTQVLNPLKDPNIRLQIVREAHSNETVLRQWMNEPGTALFYEGSSLIENRMTDRVSILNSKNDGVTFLVATDTHLPVAKMFKMRDPNTRDRDEVTELFDNWKMVQGIATPHIVQVKVNDDLVRQVYVEHITYNEHTADTIFVPPAGYNPLRK